MRKNINNGIFGKFENVTFRFNFVMIYIVHKMLVLLTNNLNYPKDSIFKCFFKEHKKLLKN